MGPTYGLRISLDQLFPSAALQTLRSASVPERERWRVESVAWEINKVTSGGNTRARLYIDRGAGDKHYLSEQLVPAADWLYTYADPQWLYPGERLSLEIDQGQASTRARLSASGYREQEV